MMYETLSNVYRKIYFFYRNKLEREKLINKHTKNYK